MVRSRSLILMVRSLRAGIPGSLTLAHPHGSLTLAHPHGSLAASRDTRLAHARSSSWFARCEPGYPARSRSLTPDDGDCSRHAERQAGDVWCRLVGVEAHLGKPVEH